MGVALMGFYDEMADFADEILSPESEGGLGQGTVTLKRTSFASTSNAWENGAATTLTYTLKAAVRGVSKKYVDGSVILDSDLQLTVSPKATTSGGSKVNLAPAMTDLITLDGKTKAPKKIMPVPAVGVVAAYMVFVEG